MKTLIKTLIVLTTFITSMVLAQDDISGTWQGKLELGPDNSLTVQFIMTKEADGSWSAVVNSPDMGGIKDVKANSAEFDGSTLKIDVVELSGAYAGVFKDGLFEGEWSQAGSSMPLNLSPYEKPVMSEADKEILLGDWVGTIKLPAGEMTIVFKFADDDAGVLKGSINLPDQGGNDMPAQDIMLKDGEFNMKLPANQVEIVATLADEKITGTAKQGSNNFDLNLTKGEYEAPETVFNLSEEDAKNLMGEWHGEVDTPAGKASSVFRFEKNSSGEYIAETYSPDQGNISTPISEISVIDGTLTIKRPGPAGGFTGKISGDEITGEVATPMGGIPLTLIRGKYIPPSYKLSLTSDAMQKLEGKWQGKINTPRGEQTVVFAFESKGEGEYYGYLQNPQAPGPGSRMIEGTLEGDDFSMKIKFPNISYKGTLSGNEIKGNLTQVGNTLPLSLTKM